MSHDPASQRACVERRKQPRGRVWRRNGLNLFDTLKQLLPRGGTITTPTVRADVQHGDRVFHIPASLSVSLSWDGDSLVVEPVNLEATQLDQDFRLFRADTRVKIVRLVMHRTGEVFGTWEKGWLSGQFKWEIPT